MGYQNPLYAPSGVRIIYIFAGAERQCDVGKYLQQLGVVDSLLQFDLLRSHTHDLTEDGLWQHIFHLLSQEEWILLASPPCETFSRVRHRHPGPKPLRSSSYPRGFPWLSQQHSLQVEQANYFVDQTVTACQLAWQYFLEHPEDLGVTPDKEIPASIWQWPSIRELQVSTRAITFAVFQCSFEAATSKPTRFLTNLQALVRQPPHFATWPKFDSEHRYVGPLPPRCPHGKHHPLSGRTGRVWATSSSAAYPPLLCEWIAHAVLASAPQGGNKSASHSLESSGKPGSGTGQVSQATGAATGQVSQSLKDHPSQASSGKPGAGTGQVSQSPGASTGQVSQSFKDHPSQASSASSAHPVSGAGKASQSGKDQPSQASSVQAPSSSSSGLEPLADPQSVQVPSAALETGLEPLAGPQSVQVPSAALEPASGSASGSSVLGSYPLKSLHRPAEDTFGKPVVEQTPKPIRPYKGISPEDFAERISATRVPTRGELCALFGLLPHETPPRAPEAGNRVASSFTTGMYHQGRLTGLRANFRRFPMSTQAITSYVRAKMPNHMFNAVSIYCNTGTDPHKDNRNAPVPNGIVALSDFKGGEVWIESEDGDSIQVVGGKQMRGTLVPITDEPVFIEAHSHLHFTMPWRGRRVVLIAFSVAGLEELTPQDYDSLISHGFSVKAPSEASEAMCADTSCMEEEATAPAGDSEPSIPFDPDACFNEGQPLKLEWDGTYENIVDGFGLCSPTRWVPEARGKRLSDRALKFSRAMHQVLKDFVLRTVADTTRTAMELALGRLKESPFSEPELGKLRAEWISCIETFSEEACLQGLEVPESQPFFLHALSSTARLLEYPDWRAVACQRDSYVTGVSLGFNEPAEHIPQVFEYKTKFRKLDESAEEWHRDNYDSAKQTADQLEEKFKAEEALGRMEPTTLPVLRERFGVDRIRVASLGAIIKPDGTARPLHDGTHGVNVNNNIKLLNQQSNPGPREVVHLVRSARQCREATFCLTGDVTAAHRLFKVRESDWPLMCCKVHETSPVVWLNKVGTFGISSSAFLWSRLFSIIGRCVARFLLNIWFYHLVFVDDVHSNFSGRDKFLHLLMWLVSFEMIGTPFAYKKFRGGLSSAFVGYELSYTDQRVGISESRGQWLLKWIREARAARFMVSVRRFGEFLGRLGFVSRLLVWIKPHLAPLYAWKAAVSESTVARLPDTVILALEYLSITFEDMTFKVSASRPIRNGGVSFRTDAKCADGFVVLGGWDCAATTQESRWLSLKLTPLEAPYLFDEKGRSQWASASAELLATLVALQVFGHLEQQSVRRLLAVEVLAQTDNKSNEGLAKRGSTTKWPLLMVNMQLSHHLMRASLRLKLAWRPRDQNTEADALTNECFEGFEDSRRIQITYGDLSLELLHSLYEARLKQLNERHSEAVCDAAVGKPRFKGKRKREKREKSPW